MGKKPRTYHVSRTKHLAVGRVTAGVKVRPRGRRKITGYVRYDAP